MECRGRDKTKHAPERRKCLECDEFGLKADMEPFNKGFLATKAQEGATSASGLLATGKVAMEMQGHWEPGVMQGLTDDGKGLGGAPDGAEVDLGDGGTTSWTAALLGDAKEFCVTSCVSVERLVTLARR